VRVIVEGEKVRKKQKEPGKGHESTRGPNNEKNFWGFRNTNGPINSKLRANRRVTDPKRFGIKKKGRKNHNAQTSPLNQGGECCLVGRSGMGRQGGRPTGDARGKAPYNPCGFKKLSAQATTGSQNDVGRTLPRGAEIEHKSTQKQRNGKGCILTSTLETRERKGRKSPQQRGYPVGGRNLSERKKKRRGDEKARRKKRKKSITTHPRTPAGTYWAQHNVPRNVHLMPRNRMSTGQQPRAKERAGQAGGVSGSTSAKEKRPRQMETDKVSEEAVNTTARGEVNETRKTKKKVIAEDLK